MRRALKALPGLAAGLLVAAGTMIIINMVVVALHGAEVAGPAAILALVVAGAVGVAFTLSAFRTIARLPLRRDRWWR